MAGLENETLFKTMTPGKALAKMALPTIGSQLIILIYNLADTWFIGRTNNPYMIGASSLALTVYLAAVALANAFSSFQRALSACSSSRSLTRMRLSTQPMRDYGQAEYTYP